jgi:hypothetical protein
MFNFTWSWQEQVGATAFEMKDVVTVFVTFCGEIGNPENPWKCRQIETEIKSQPRGPPSLVWVWNPSLHQDGLPKLQINIKHKQLTIFWQ